MRATDLKHVARIERQRNPGLGRSVASRMSLRFIRATLAATKARLCPTRRRADTASPPGRAVKKGNGVMDQNPARVDVLIGGAGFAGLSLAIALTQALGPSFSVAVVDPALAAQDKDDRASAIAAAARRLFETIGVWDAAAGRAQPILDIVVTDSQLGD